MANLRFRFRKSFTIIPGILKWTVSKRGWSLNLNLGLFSRTWGTRGTTTTIDAPGTSGIFWRKEERRKRKVDHVDGLEETEEKDGFGFFIFLLVIQGAFAAINIWVHPFSHCYHNSGVTSTLGLLLGGELVIMIALYQIFGWMRGWVVLPVGLLMTWGAYIIYMSQIASHVHCV